MDEPRFYIKPPEGCTFRDCDICQSPYAFDGRLSNCLWCEISKKTEPIDELHADLLKEAVDEWVDHDVKPLDT